MNLSGDARTILDALPGTVYVTGADDRLIHCGGRGWGRFATENGGTEIADPSALIGSTLGSLIAGEAARDAHELVRSRILSGARQEVTYDFNCAGPEESRSMRLSAAPFRAGDQVVGIVYTSQTLSVERWARAVSVLERQLAPRGGVQPERLLTMCSYCKSVEITPGHWVPVETVNVDESEAGNTGISHGICDICFSLVVTPLLGEAPMRRH